MKEPEKQHDTGLRILEILKILLSESVSTNELLEKLKIKSEEKQVFSQEVISKYINTFKVLGLSVIKDKHVHHLENALYEVKFNKIESKMLCKIVKDISKLNNKSEEKVMHNIVKRFDKYTTEKLSKLQEKIKEEEKFLYNKNIKENVITTLKNMMFDKQNVVIVYEKNNGEEETITVELKEILEQKNNIYIVCYDPKVGRNKKICVKTIKSMKQSPQKIANISFLNTVVFEISGRLATVYKLKPSEKVINFSNNHITISNAEEDKDVLIHRLLKYGANCKIIRPQSVQNDFLALTENILKNLETN